MSKELEQDFRIRELERKVAGIQRQQGIQTARFEAAEKRTDMRIRDLEIKAAVQSGVSQRTVAKIYDLSAGRVNQILKKVG